MALVSILTPREIPYDWSRQPAAHLSKTLIPAEPLWSKTGTVTISAGLRTDSKGQDGTTNMYAHKPTGGGVVQVLSDMKIIPRP